MTSHHPPRSGGGARRARLLDEIAANATVAPVTRLVDGWLAKSAPDLPFRRASAVLPPLGAADHPEQASALLNDLQRWYASRGQRLLVQVSTADPEAHLLDALLAARGMVVEAPVNVMAASIADVTGAAASRGTGETVIDIQKSVGVDRNWAAVHAEVHGNDRSARGRVEAYGRMLQPLGSMAVGAVASRDGDPAGIGFAVVERGWIGVFGMGTALGHRRQGVAAAVLAALVDVGRGSGAVDAYLQVERDNGFAQALYARMGFTSSHCYHYRAAAAP